MHFTINDIIFIDNYFIKINEINYCKCSSKIIIKGIDIFTNAKYINTFLNLYLQTIKKVNICYQNDS